MGERNVHLFFFDKSDWNILLQESVIARSVSGLKKNLDEFIKDTHISGS